MKSEHFHNGAFILWLDMYEMGKKMDYIKTKLSKIINFSQDFLHSYMKEMQTLSEERLFQIHHVEIRNPEALRKSLTQ